MFFKGNQACWICHISCREDCIKSKRQQIVVPAILKM